MASSSPESILLQTWSGPFGGVPPFDRIRLEDFAPAIERGMALQRAELEALVSNPDAPTFENTILAYEQAGFALGRALTVYWVWSGGLASSEFQALETELSPKLAAFSDEVVQNERLFARIRAVATSKEARARLTPEQGRLLDRHYDSFVRQGAALDETKKASLRTLNQRLAALATRFAQNVLRDEEEGVLTIERKEDLGGLPAAQIDAAAEEAQRRGRPGVWMISNTRSAMEPFLTSSTNRALREAGWRLWMGRGDSGGERDNNEVVKEILSLRAQKAQLLGYSTFAHWRLADSMAKTPETALALMTSVWKAASAQFKRDVGEAQRLADADGVRIAPWDYRAYAEKLRKAKFDLDLEELKPYLQLERLREAMFWVAEQLYELKFTRRDGLPVFHSDVTVYEVTRKGRTIGLWYFDPFARPGKQSGAWMSAYREQHRLSGDVLALVSNNSNFIKPAPGRDVTLSWDDARTLFHEFGHALHGLLSNVTYPTLSGTATLRDFVELPSQLNEHWLSTPEVLRFLVNEHGQPIPAALLARLEKAKTFNEGFATSEAQLSAIIEMRLHLAGTAPIEPKAFEQQLYAELGVPPELVMRHRIPAFGHVFSGEGYAAGYYSYVWAEVLERDVYEAFLEGRGPYDRAVAQRFHDSILSVGNTVDPAEAFRSFRGRDPRPEALLRAKGLVAATS